MSARALVRPTMAGLALAWFLAACSETPPHVVVRVEDPARVASEATDLFAGRPGGEWHAAELGAPLQFPIEITVSTTTAGEAVLLIEARTADGAVLGRGAATTTLKRQGTPTALVTLAQACAGDRDCFDGTFCDGTELCRAGVCLYEDVPCSSPHPCVLSVCLEETQSCDVTVDHLQCATDEYCDVVLGCVPGRRCRPENQNTDCWDTSVCNGEERCVDYHCVGGVPPDVNDSDPCTLDGCDDNRADPIFHQPLPARDGNDCTQPGGPRSVCVATRGGCAESECGDGVIDPDRGELCDQGSSNDDGYSLAPSCRTDCTSWAPFCGDGDTDAGLEQCDEGSANGSGTGCTATCSRDGFCGDGEVQAVYEDCDDGPGDDDNCDGCRTDCQRGCICSAPAACPTGEWCDDGACAACDTSSHCGPACVTCPDDLPTCGGPDAGCGCDSAPSPRGSCLPGSRCVGDACVACDATGTCGQECVACAGDTPVCAGIEEGCVADPAGSGCTGQLDFTPCLVVTPSRSYNICIDEVCVEPGCGDVSCNPPAPHFPLPDTNVRQCWGPIDTIPCPGTPGDPSCATTPFCGQDAQYGWDTQNSASARFSITNLVGGERVVTDEVTGLMWQQCVAGLSGPGCATGDGAAEMSWTEALGYCDGSSWAGYTDWHLPDRFELQSILDYNDPPPAVDQATFPTTARFLWTLSTDNQFSFYATSIAATTGYASTGAKATFVESVQCVRNATEPLRVANRFSVSETVADEPVVRDEVTELVWQGCAAGLRGSDCAIGSFVDLSWEAALAHCEGLAWGGEQDWRLPNLRELYSITEDGRSRPAIDPVAFPATPDGTHDCFWSSTPHRTFDHAWCTSFELGRLAQAMATDLRPVRCVRAGRWQ